MVTQSIQDEDVEYLERWLELVKKRVSELRDVAIKDGVESIFTIGTTGKSVNKRPYLTPLRFQHDCVISGATVFSQTQAVLVASLIDGNVDRILADAEKKLSISVQVDHSVLERFGLRPPSGVHHDHASLEMGNVSKAIFQSIKKTKVLEYKANDLTVEAVWLYVSQKLGCLSGKKISILGCGNIGFKLALKFVESGANVEIHRTNTEEGMLMANAINVTKPRTTIARANFNFCPLQSSVFSDALIGATPGIPIITWEMIQSMSPKGLLIDVGKGTIEDDAVKNALENDIEVIRTDIAPALHGFVTAVGETSASIDERIGRRTIDDRVVVVSGGALGHEGDVVVDRYTQPKEIYGICDGLGDLKKELTPSDYERIEFLNNLISRHGSTELTGLRNS